jgi:heme oxygenase
VLELAHARAAHQEVPVSETIPFHQSVRRSTLEAHQRANHSPFMDALFDGRLAVADYARLVEQYAFVYGALESAGEVMAQDPVAGGQAVAALLPRRYGVTGGGTAFYDFSALGPVPRFRAHYRALLDAAPWDEDERARVVDEVAQAYELNIAMFHDLWERAEPVAA